MTEEPPADPPADPTAVLADAVALLREQLDRVQHRNDELVEQLRSRADEPLVRDLVLLVDSCTRTARDWADRGAADTADALAGVADDLRMALARAGVEAFEPEPGEAFDRRTARAVRVQDVADAGADGHVVTVLRPGWRSGERLLRYADVVVGRFTSR